MSPKWNACFSTFFFLVCRGVRFIRMQYICIAQNESRFNQFKLPMIFFLLTAHLSYFRWYRFYGNTLHQLFSPVLCRAAQQIKRQCTIIVFIIIRFMWCGEWRLLFVCCSACTIVPANVWLYSLYTTIP